MKFIRDLLARRRIKGMFGHHVSNSELGRLVASSPEPTPGAREQEMTPFFASVHGYVGLAEQLPLSRLHELMNAYFDACAGEIEAQAGCLDKFVGDAVIAMFGTPVPSHRHAFHACRAALGCQARVAELRHRFRRAGDWPNPAGRLRVRVGLHTGVALLGNFGSRTRFNYTMMGDTVNLAARLESLAKAYGVWILCSEPTRRASEATDPGRLLFRSLGPITIAGRSESLRICELLAPAEDASAPLRECVAQFEAGLRHFEDEEWEPAGAAFQRSAKLEPNPVDPDAGIIANPSTIFLQLARARGSAMSTPRE